MEHLFEVGWRGKGVGKSERPIWGDPYSRVKSEVGWLVVITLTKAFLLSAYFPHMIAFHNGHPIMLPGICLCILVKFGHLLEHVYA